MRHADALHFSVVVPTYNRPWNVENLLRSLECLRYDGTSFEVVLVDDGGSASLEPHVSRFRSTMNLTLLHQKNQGPGAARNLGAQRSGGKFLAFTDDDCLPDKGWLRALAGGFEKDEDIICGGRTVNELDRNPFSKASQSLLNYLVEHFSPGMRTGGFFPAQNFAVSRRHFLEMGGFDRSLRFGEDRDLCCRWASAGKRFLFVPDAVVFHRHILNLFSFVRLHFSYGRGTYRVRKGIVAKGLKPIELSSPAWYLDLILSGMRRERNLAGILQSALLALSQASNAMGIAWCALKDAL